MAAVGAVNGIGSGGKGIVVGGRGIGARGTEVGEDGLSLHLALAQSSEIIGDSLFLVEADQAGVGANEAFVEDAAGELVEMLVLNSAKHARTDFGGAGDG